MNYRVFGFNVKSPVTLSAALVKDERSDVIVQYGGVDRPSSTAATGDMLYRSTDSEFLFGIDDRIRFAVRDGSEIRVQCGADEDHRFVKMILEGSPFGALLHQRALLALHGCTFLVDGRAYVILGRSGAGKSTLAAGLAALGCPVYSDDLTALHVGRGAAEALPGFRQFKLFGDSVRQLGHEPAQLEPLRPGVRKLGFPIPPLPDSGTAPLHGIFELDISTGSEIAITPLAGVDKIRTLLANTYRRQFLQALGLTSRNYQQCAAVAMSVPIWQVLRPRNPFMLDELLDAIRSRAA